MATRAFNNNASNIGDMLAPALRGRAAGSALASANNATGGARTQRGRTGGAQTALGGAGSAGFQTNGALPPAYGNAAAATGFGGGRTGRAGPQALGTPPRSPTGRRGRAAGAAAGAAQPQGALAASNALGGRGAFGQDRLGGRGALGASNAGAQNGFQQQQGLDGLAAFLAGAGPAQDSIANDQAYLQNMFGGAGAGTGGRRQGGRRGGAGRNAGAATGLAFGDGGDNLGDGADNADRTYVQLNEQGYRMGPRFKSATPYAAALKAASQGTERIILHDRDFGSSGGGRVYFYAGWREPITEHTAHTLKYNMTSVPKVRSLRYQDLDADGRVVRTKDYAGLEGGQY
jgi:hypothetical protein